MAAVVRHNNSRNQSRIVFLTSAAFKKIDNQKKVDCQKVAKRVIRNYKKNGLNIEVK